MDQTLPPHQTLVEKPWGQEIILTPPSTPYTGKILKIKAGRRLSLQIHEEKQETLTLFSGQATLNLGTDLNALEEIQMQPLYGYTIPQNTIHRVTCQKDSLILESSTPESGTTKRLQDDYQRSDETELERNKLHDQKQS
jgi:mannose-6-phosphate isomerase